MASVEGALGPAIAFGAGVLSFVSPCVLPMVPVYVARVAGVSAGGAGASRRAVTLSHAAAFVLGFSVVFAALGASVGLVGYAFRDLVPTILKVAGVFLILLGLQMMGLIRVPFLARSAQVDVAGDRRGYLGSFLVGATFSLGWTPCIGPTLGAILGLASTSGGAWQGLFLLLFYSLGLGVPFLLVGLFTGTLTGWLKRIGPASRVAEVAAGMMIIAFAVLMLAGRLTVLNQYFAGLGSPPV